MDDRLLNETELAEYMGFKVQTIRVYLKTKPDKLPPFIDFGSRKRWRLETVKRFMAEREGK